MDGTNQSIVCPVEMDVMEKMGLNWKDTSPSVENVIKKAGCKDSRAKAASEDAKKD